ncbi:hypothetical protein P154DRAFT_116555 [Amniculicola lignicola CBS 123094]|uniref:Uncharacterized protein n=1 Tax=Amniculicola lignicola CBS 123094 TaxID=1392246 RepID=A0A6A5X1W0_9PLEO|nr:hypothetical protein P154DRAFT_116555 [Amniculicola lignicola CBS 123094]
MSAPVHHFPRYSKFTINAWGSVHKIQVFLQGLTHSNLSSFFRSCRNLNLCPKILILTTRYTDWFLWEESHPLAIDKSQMALILLPVSISTVIVKLEMIEAREKELDDLVKLMMANKDDYRWHRADGVVLQMAGLEKEWRWDGPTRFGDGKTFEHHPKGDSMQYVLKGIQWAIVSE